MADAPSVTDWMQGWGSLLSLPLSLGALIFTGRLLRHEIRARHEEKADLAIAQARLVAGRLTGYQLNDDGTVRDLKYEVTNYSDAPVFFVFPTIWDEENDDEYQSDLTHHVLESQSVAESVVRIDSVDEPEFEGGKPQLSQYKVRFRFIDKNGIEWRRLNYETPLRGFNEPLPTRAQRVRTAPSRRLEIFRLKIKYGPWSSAARRRKRAAARFQPVEAPSDERKLRDPPPAEE